MFVLSIVRSEGRVEEVGVVSVFSDGKFSVMSLWEASVSLFLDVLLDVTHETLFEGKYGDTSLTKTDHCLSSSSSVFFSFCCRLG